MSQRVDDFIDPKVCSELRDLPSHIVKWRDNRAFLVKKKNTVAMDADMAMKSYKAAVGGVWQAKKAIKFVDDTLGEKATITDYEAKMNDKKVGLTAWLADAARAKAGSKEFKYKKALIAKAKKRKKGGSGSHEMDNDEEAYISELEALDEPCINWSFWGSCRHRRTRCRREHKAEDKGKYKELTDSQGKKLCMFYASGLECKDGEACKFAHEHLPAGKHTVMNKGEKGLVTREMNKLFDRRVTNRNLPKVTSDNYTAKILTKSISYKSSESIREGERMNSVHNKRDSNPLFDPKTATETEQNHIIDDNTSINMPVKSAAFTAALQCERNRSPPSNPMEGDTGELGEKVHMGKRKKNDIKVVTFSHIDDIIPHPKPNPNPNSNARVKV